MGVQRGTWGSMGLQKGAKRCIGVHRVLWGLHGGGSGGAGTLEASSSHPMGSCHPPSPNQFVTQPLIPLIHPQPEPPHLLN